MTGNSQIFLGVFTSNDNKFLYHSPCFGEKEGKDALIIAQLYQGHTVIFLLGKTGQIHKLTEQALGKCLKGTGGGGTRNTLQGTRGDVLDSFM